MSKVTIWILFLAVLAYGCFCLFLYIRQRSLIYYPHPEVKATELQPIWLDNDGQKLKVWRGAVESKTALLYFGGNAENVLQSSDELQRIYPDSTLYLMNYRGYGGSTGKPTEEALFSDALALYDRVASGHEEVIVMGRSLGTAVAVNLAAVRPVKGMVLVTPYSSMVALARHYYPFLPVNALLKDRFESSLYAPHIDIPVLALIAERDEIIPAKISDGLITSFNEGVAEKVVIETAYHNTIDNYPSYNSSIKNFITRLQQEK
ncbi:MAG: alpha/beta hydrolase [Desulfocapsaceae bacterium]